MDHKMVKRRERVPLAISCGAVRVKGKHYRLSVRAISTTSDARSTGRECAFQCTAVASPRSTPSATGDIKGAHSLLRVPTHHAGSDGEEGHHVEHDVHQAAVEQRRRDDPVVLMVICTSSRAADENDSDG